mgnify:CR=1 FL=1
MLTGLDQPTDGTISLNGEDITRWTPARRSHAGLARTFQHGHSFAGLTVRENIEVAALGVDESPAVARERADELLGLLHLEQHADQPAAGLPHGAERLLGVARALATDPRFVLLDEPAAGLNEDEAAEFADVIRRIRTDHTEGVLLIAHNISLVFDVCERIYVLDQGELLAEGTADELRANPEVLAAYLGHG